MSSDSVERIGGWLLAPLAWLLVALLSASLSLLFFAKALMSSQTYTLLGNMSAEHLALWIASLAFAIAMWYYTLWLTIAFFKRRKGGTETLHHLAADHAAVGGESLCLFPDF